MVKNDVIGHSEDPANTWYTPEGDLAAQNSDVMVSGSTLTTDAEAIDIWMQGPFHAIGIIDPALAQTGFGNYREAIGYWNMGAVLDVIRGRGTIPVTVTFPVYFPAQDQIMPLRAYNGHESPDPLTSCTGYTWPSGPPIILQLGDGSLTPNVTAHSFQDATSTLESCEFDETNYTNPTPGYDTWGRSILDGRDAVVVMPRAPLVAGGTYTVSITADSQVYTWSFSVDSQAKVQAAAVTGRPARR